MIYVCFFLAGSSSVCVCHITRNISVRENKPPNLWVALCAGGCTLILSSIVGLFTAMATGIIIPAVITIGLMNGTKGAIMLGVVISIICLIA